MFVILLGLFAYAMVKVIDNKMDNLFSFIESKIKHSENEHKEAIAFRRDSSGKIKELSDKLVEETEFNSLILFEYSNGSQNISGLPFLYMSATHEIVPNGVEPSISKYQKINTTLFADFLSDLEKDNMLYVQDLNNIKEVYPIMYNILDRLGAKSAAFYSVEGIEGPIGMLVLISCYCLNEENSDINKKNIYDKGSKIASLLDYKSVAKHTPIVIKRKKYLGIF